MSGNANKFSFLNSKTIHIIILVAVGILCYSNTFNVPFQWDDIDLIEDYPIVRDLSYFSEPSKASHLDSYGALINRYIGYLTFALNYKIHGLDVTGYHIANVSIHVINAVLVYIFVILTFKTPFFSESHLLARSKLIAFFSALFFVSHPIQTEAVTYIFQRLASLVTMFYLLSMLCYIKYRLLHTEGSNSSGKTYILRFRAFCWWLSASVLFAVLAMKTKENAFTLPFIIALYEFSFFNGQIKGRLIRLVPILLTLLIIPLSMVDFDRAQANIITMVVDAARGERRISRPDYLFTQFRVIVTYMRLLFLPVNQNIDYDYPVFHSFFNPQVFLSFIFLFSAFCFAVYLFYRSRITDHGLRLTAFGIFWFFITLSVESSVIPIPMIINEYRVYLPSVGMFSGIIAGSFLMIKKFRSGHVQTFILSFLVVITLIFSYTSYSRNTVWGSQKSLWEDVVKKSPNRARSYYNLGCMYLTEGLMDKAKENFQIALKLRPDFADAHTNLGIAYRGEGMIDKAIEHYFTALKLKPGDADIYNNIGNALRIKGMTDKAIEYYLTAVKLKPDDADTYKNLGDVFGTKDLPDKAAEYYSISLRLAPDVADTHFKLGNIYYKKRLFKDARRELEIALILKPDLLQARHLLSQMYK